jgi:hypothetical protein
MFDIISNIAYKIKKMNYTANYISFKSQLKRIYYKGIYYDPEFCILKECPSQAKIFQIWEIYT